FLGEYFIPRISNIRLGIRATHKVSQNTLLTASSASFSTVECAGFKYYRHGTLSLYAALNTQTGEVIGKTAARHTSEEFVAFLSDLLAHQPKHREIHPGPYRLEAVLTGFRTYVRTGIPLG